MCGADSFLLEVRTQAILGGHARAKGVQGWAGLTTHTKAQVEGDQVLIMLRVQTLYVDSSSFGSFVADASI